ncbi:hypothetical protein SynMITS9220_02345 [Synechococcus sp. MIT S9220]|uniref:hypothetical protein n=1 Tax=unclassified Synechococcus TaxID=2626047 RepID=UPI00164BF09B|nr:hypothetical protein [Synechococcus sp. MIT S9220]NOL46279.1 hypothetical protein [Synechococcus sp. MIT S9220]QNJ23630.1 hypothetical protein SynMITS9220_02345 [Synechococcus sp. MIT S9220]
MGIRLFVRSLLPLLMLLQACDGTPFGQRLSESFDSQAGDVSPAGAKADPDTSVVADKGEQQSKVNENDKPTASVSKDGDATESDESERKSEREQSPAPAVATHSPKPRSTPERTLPYRIMIRLSAADPAAPAEGVTEALRRAGIGFEVETIEKVPASDRNQSSNLQPKPAS